MYCTVVRACGTIVLHCTASSYNNISIPPQHLLLLVRFAFNDLIKEQVREPGQSLKDLRVSQLAIAGAGLKSTPNRSAPFVSVFVFSDNDVGLSSEYAYI